MWRISTKFEILAIIMWNLLKPIPKIGFCPILAKMMAKFLKMLKRFYFASENGIFKILHILKHLTEIWREAHLAK